MHTVVTHILVYANCISCLCNGQGGVECRLRPIMLKNLPIMLLSIAQKIAHYAQNYAHVKELCLKL